MKKIFKLTLMVALMGGLSLNVTSCKSDEDVVSNENQNQITTLTIDADILSHGITTDVHDAIVDIPVKCDGDWMAWIENEQDVDWLSIAKTNQGAIDVYYTGDKTLRLVFDENHTKIDRSAKLCIATLDGEPIVINVTQTQLWNGEAPGNSSAQWFGDKGLGCGINYSYFLENDSTRTVGQKFSPTAMVLTNPIFNWATIVELQKKIDQKTNLPYLSADAYKESFAEDLNFDEIFHDSLVSGKDTISIKFDVEIGFGFIQFEAHGKYDSKELKGSERIRAYIGRKITAYDVSTSPAELAETAEDIGGELSLDPVAVKKALNEIDSLRTLWIQTSRNGKLTSRQEKRLEQMREQALCPDYANIFSKSFGRLYFNITNDVYKLTDSDPAVAAEARRTLDARLEKLDADYGPLYIGKGSYGGSINLSVEIDTASVNTTGKFDGGLAAGFGNWGNIEGNFHYEESTKKVIKNSDIKLAIYGGDAVNTANAIMKHFAGDMSDYDKLQDTLKGWGESLFESKVDQKTGTSVPSHAILEQMQLYGIWGLFIDELAAKEVRDFMYKKHPTLKNYLGSIIE